MKIVAIASRFPFPLEKGDKGRIYFQMRHLASAGHEVVLVAISEGEVPPEHLAELHFCSRIHIVPLGRARRALGLARAATAGRPLQVGYFESPRVATEIRRVVALEQPDAVYCQLIRAAAYGRDMAVPTTLDYQDCFSASARRRADTAAWPLRPLLRVEARRVAAYEARVKDWFDHRMIISEQDRGLLLPEADPDRVGILHNGVDVEDFRPDALEVGPRFDVCFIGNLGYRPNVEAANRLVRDVLPALRDRVPGATVLLAGARPARSVLALEQEGVEVRGWVDDIRAAYLEGTVLVAPLFTGAGQQNKVIEAMALGRPCVTTELVNNALGARPGVEILTARDDDEFARHTADLLGDPDRRADIVRAAREFVVANYSWPVVNRALELALGAC